MSDTSGNLTIGLAITATIAVALGGLTGLLG
jgi:hypothetical protein